jgi:hypothetical protein
MGSSAANFVRMSLVLSLLLWWSFANPPGVASQDSNEEAIFTQSLKEAAQELEQQKKEQALAKKQLLRKQRSTREFESLLDKARQQHSRIKEWQKKNSMERKVYATSVRKKRHLVVAVTLFR